MTLKRINNEHTMNTVDVQNESIYGSKIDVDRRRSSYEPISTDVS